MCIFFLDQVTMQAKACGFSDVIKHGLSWQEKVTHKVQDQPMGKEVRKEIYAAQNGFF